MFWVGDKNILVTGSWDKTLRYWDLRSERHVGSVKLSDRVYCMDVKGNLCVVGTAAKKLHVFTMENPFNEYRVCYFLFFFLFFFFFFFFLSLSLLFSFSPPLPPPKNSKSTLLYANNSVASPVSPTEKASPSAPSKEG